MVERKKSITRSEQKQQTRERLIDAAIEIFRKVGYGPATVNMIAARAKTSRPTFYANFKDKEEVSFYIAERIVGVLEKSFNELDKIDNPTPDEIWSWLKKLVRLMKKHRIVLEAAASAIVADSPETQNYINELQLHSERCMPRHLAKLQGADREAFINKFMMLRMLQERLFFVTLVREADFPSTEAHPPLKLMAQMWWNELFRDTRF